MYHWAVQWGVRLKKGGDFRSEISFLLKIDIKHPKDAKRLFIFESSR